MPTEPKPLKKTKIKKKSLIDVHKKEDKDIKSVQPKRKAKVMKKLDDTLARIKELGEFPPPPPEDMGDVVVVVVKKIKVYLAPGEISLLVWDGEYWNNTEKEYSSKSAIEDVLERVKNKKFKSYRDLDKNL